MTPITVWLADTEQGQAHAANNETLASRSGNAGTYYNSYRYLTLPQSSCFALKCTMAWRTPVPRGHFCTEVTPVNKNRTRIRIDQIPANQLVQPLAITLQANLVLQGNFLPVCLWPVKPPILTSGLRTLSMSRRAFREYYRHRRLPPDRLVDHRPASENVGRLLN